MFKRLSGTDQRLYFRIQLRVRNLFKFGWPVMYSFCNGTAVQQQAVEFWDASESVLVDQVV